MNVDPKSKFLGGILGSALGDAIGEMAFSHPHEKQLFLNVNRASLLRYTDDTAMAIGLAESIIEKGLINKRNLGDSFNRNFQREPWRGYASGPPTIFSLVRKHDINYPDAARMLFGGTGSLGNGAAMRIVPVGLFFHNAENIYGTASASAEVTHAHPIGMDGAAVQALAIAQAVKLMPGEEFPLDPFMRALIDFARTPEIRMKMGMVRDCITEGVSSQVVADRIGRSVAVHESMPFAIYAFLKNPNSFEACLTCAILNGGDRDTLGAMACAISGAYLGIEAIPDEWTRKLENRDYLEELAIKLFNILQC